MNKVKPTRKKIPSPFARNLKKILEERGISQRGAAEIAGVNVAVLHDWLNGSVPHDHSAVLKLCKALSCDFQWLLTDTHAQIEAKDFSISEIFDVQDDPDYSGIFMIEAKRLRRRSE